MSDIVIRAQGLGKRYRLTTAVEPATTRLGRVGQAMAAPFRYLTASLREPTPEETLWAVRDVSFEVRRGEVVGLIGRNGAGKSTLLKILTRITDPTTGEAHIRGRVGSLLEVGTGFHPELSGRENIFLNGSILGMTRREIAARFDEIVAFAEIDRFLDTAVKRYSSGMYVRLAFSVAAHLEPDVLIVDEVLAVGDAAFQRKCLDKMEEVTGHGRTILFVSHSIPAVNRLCTTGLLLDSGTVVERGPIGQVTSRYLAQTSTAPGEWVGGGTEVSRGGEVSLQRVAVTDGDGIPRETYPINRPLRVEVEYDCLRPPAALHCQVQVLNELGEVLFVAADHLEKARRRIEARPGRWRSSCSIPGNLLAEGAHFVSVVLIDLDQRRKYLAKRRVVSFWVIDPSDGTTARGLSPGEWPGVVRPLLEWNVESLGPVPVQAGPEAPTHLAMR